MTLQSENPRQSHAVTIPSPDRVTDTPGTAEESVIRAEIIESLGEGEHHADEIPSTDTVLPPINQLREMLTALGEYLYTIGASILCEAHLQGLGATVTTTTDGTIYAYLDRDVFESVITRVLRENASLNIPTSESRNRLTEAVIWAHTIEFQSAVHETGSEKDTTASWPTVTGKQTNDPVGIVFTTPHPVRILETSAALSERGVALVAGIQRLADDLDSVYTQTDIALPYLTTYLQTNGESVVQANQLVSNWYDQPGECVRQVTEKISGDISTSGFPSEDPEFRYYLTEAVHSRLS